MSENTYQILYCSRNNIHGSVPEIRAEIEGILVASRKNNAKVGVTGALFYNTVLFAQVLEGRFRDVQQIFERLQLDSRHSDLVVLQSGYVAQRDFADWSMAYAGTSADFALPFGVDEGVAASGVPLDGDKVGAFLRAIVIKQDHWALPERPSMIRPTSMVTAPALQLDSTS